jgi:uncharacterized membrane protein
MSDASTDDGPPGFRADDEETPLQTVAAGAVTFVTLGVAFGLLALGNPFFWVAFPVGFGGGLPLAVGLARWYESRAEARDEETRRGQSDTDTALEELRDRYARGELDDDEFEARVERLLETESVRDAKASVDRRRNAEETGERAVGDRVAEDERA